MTKVDYIRGIVRAVAEKSTCPKSQVGAVFVNSDFEIIATGYNGAPRGFAHCGEMHPQCQPDADGKCSVAIHAEMNAILQAAKRGTALKGSMLFVSRWPCRRCAMALANLGITTVVSNGRRNPDGELVLTLAKIDMMEGGA